MLSEKAEGVERVEQEIYASAATPLAVVTAHTSVFHNKILAERTSQWGPAKQRGRELLEQLVEETLKIQQDPS